MNWVEKIGRRNLAYAAFVVVLLPLALLLEAGGPGGPDAGGGMMFGIIVWALASLGFFVVNLFLLVRALAKNLSARKPFIACLLPALLIGGTLLAEEIMLR
nr:hypothetical protein [uncultured Dongia sp.]